MSTRASDDAGTKTGFTGIWIHGKSIRVDFIYKGERHRHTLGIEPSKANIKHASRLRGAAREALRVLIEDASPRLAVDLKVWLNRHESRTDSVRILLSPKTQARNAMVNPWYAPSAWNTKWATLIRRAKILCRRWRQLSQICPKESLPRI